MMYRRLRAKCQKMSNNILYKNPQVRQCSEESQFNCVQRLLWNSFRRQNACRGVILIILFFIIVCFRCKIASRRKMMISILLHYWVCLNFNYFFRLFFFLIKYKHYFALTRYSRYSLPPISVSRIERAYFQRRNQCCINLKCAAAFSISKSVISSPKASPIDSEHRNWWKRTPSVLSEYNKRFKF